MDIYTIGVVPPQKLYLHLKYVKSSSFGSKQLLFTLYIQEPVLLLTLKKKFKSDYTKTETEVSFPHFF